MYCNKNKYILHFLNMAYLNGYYWFNALEWNGYYRLNNKTKEVEYLGLFEHADIFASKLFYQIIPYQKYIFFIPWFSDYLVRLDIQNLNTQYWKLPEEILFEKAKFRAANLYKEKIFMFPMYGDRICIFDIKSESFSDDNTWIKKELYCEKWNTYGDFLPGYQIENNVYLSNYSRNIIVKYNMEDNNYEIIFLPDTEKGSLCVEKYSENELLILTRKGNIWKYDLINRTNELFYKYKGEKECPYNNIVFYENVIYLIPRKEQELEVIINRERKVRVFPDNWRAENNIAGIDMIFCGYLKEENKILLLPCTGNMLLEIVPECESLTGFIIYDDIQRHAKQVFKHTSFWQENKKVLWEKEMGFNFFTNMLENIGEQRIENPINNKGFHVWDSIKMR